MKRTSEAIERGILYGTLAALVWVLVAMLAKGN